MLLITKITNFWSLKIALLLVLKHFELPPSEVLELFQFEERQIYQLKGPTVELDHFYQFKPDRLSGENCAGSGLTWSLV